MNVKTLIVGVVVVGSRMIFGFPSTLWPAHPVLAVVLFAGAVGAAVEGVSMLAKKPQTTSADTP